MAPVFKAEGFIWLIVGIFWVVAQIAGAAAKKNQPRRPVDSGDNEPMPPSADPFAELMRKLSEVQRIEAPQQEYKELPEEPVEKPLAFVPRNAWRVGDIEKLPDIQPLRRETAPSPEPAIQSPKVDIRPKMSAFRSTLPAMKLPAMSLRFQPLEINAATGGKPGTHFPTIGKVIDPTDRKALRRAMLSHIIFSPPKALE